MDKIELTREEAMLVMRLLNLFLGKAQALKQNIFDQFMKLDTKEAENDAE